MPVEYMNGRPAENYPSVWWAFTARSGPRLQEQPGVSPQQSQDDRRRARRYELRLPGEVWKTRRPELRQDALTMNISSRGVLFVLAEGGVQEFRPRERIQFRIYLLTNQPESFEVVLWGAGRVVRVAHQASAEWPRQLAVELERHQILREPMREDCAKSRPWC
jgi:hypothetical protein